jgi:DNA-binding MarR family transcriptional regulator
MDHVVADRDTVALATSLERVVSMVRRLAPSEGMSLTAVSTLRHAEMVGPVRTTELAAAQGVTQPAMTQLVTRLERDGYLVRTSSDADARVVLVDITRAGRELLAHRRALRAERLSELLRHVPVDDRAAILAATPALNLLADLGRNL